MNDQREGIETEGEGRGIERMEKRETERREYQREEKEFQDQCSDHSRRGPPAAGCGGRATLGWPPPAKLTVSRRPGQGGKNTLCSGEIFL